MTPLTITIFEFHKVISALTVPIPTLSLVKASLYAWKQPYHSRSDIHGHLSLPHQQLFISSCSLSSVRPQKAVIRCHVLYAKALISAPAPLNTFGSWLQLKFVFVFPHLGAVGWEPHDGALESKWHIRIPTLGRPVLVRWWWTNIWVSDLLCVSHMIFNLRD